ncbi:MAG: endonuclease/exonuclease/phosphatase family protein [Rhodoferax sp.]|jgi:endonuclease/exonuclease/phosphatase family metal-dependent hydrolase|uniref:endonuclease/exonuclease/phosphatase family protein n=1 Tax=Rhodoferax sp. TaxID=50421 RepID=UPI001B402065|nr:endonuclease/exonuclease/phosphatase family protein [Rhodoferax sp.]MBP9735926.1 endonuclease/exonuclease/phosphatase family protein [Rhodoferax sp.]MBP9906269.1 endonuclease/exonuclease/phosphatase family protein [Rhodoferax sp.]
MKLITWNTQWCCGTDGVVSPERIVVEARAMADFDVLCLQEISQGFDGLPGEPGDQPAQLQALLPGYQVFFGAAVDGFGTRGQRQRFGNLIATRLPVVNVQHYPLPWPADPSVPSMARMCSSVTIVDPVLGTLRVMTTHLEYYSAGQRMAQTCALRELQAQACTLALQPPKPENETTPFRCVPHTTQALLCGDFNFEPGAPEYAAIQEPFWATAQSEHVVAAIENGSYRWHDAWRVCHNLMPHAPTFRLYDRLYGPQPITCDYVWISDALAARRSTLSVNADSRASDHQPLLLELT